MHVIERPAEIRSCSLLARLINLMDGAGGYEGWRWIFSEEHAIAALSCSDLRSAVLEGIATVVIAFASFWMLYDYPDTAKFLNSAEKRYVVRRLKLDNDGLSHEYKTKFIKDAFLGKSPRSDGTDVSILNIAV